MTNGFLVSVPHEGLHGAISIPEQGPELPTNMCKAWAVKDVMPLIAYCMCIAECAPAQLPGDHWPGKPALLNRQGMGAHPKLHQQPHSGKRHGDVKIRLKTQPAWAKKPCKVRAQLGSLGGSQPRGHMQTIPDFAVLPLHVCLKTQRIQGNNPRR